jgi:hypothetical protein
MIVYSLLDEGFLSCLSVCLSVYDYFSAECTHTGSQYNETVPAFKMGIISELAVLLDVTQCGFVYRYQRFGRTC